MNSMPKWAWLVFLSILAVPVHAEEAIVASGFTESAWYSSCPEVADNAANPGGCATYYHAPLVTDDGKMRFICKDSHYAYDDPIVFPGTAGPTHLHMFFSNPHTNKDSTFQTLRANVDQGTCAGGPLNNTGYWAPAMIRPQSNQVVKPDFIEFYYQVNRADLVDYDSPACSCGGGGQGHVGCNSANALIACPTVATQRIERGMKAIFGYRPGLPGFPTSPAVGNVFDWSCPDNAVGGKTRFWDRSTPANGVQGCPSGSTIQVRIQATPTCWDGTYDSTDHYSHLLYSVQDGYGGLACPSTHTKRIPALTIILAWTTLGESDYSQWYLSSDRFNGADFEAGQSFHTDAYWAWSQNVMDSWTTDILGIPGGAFVGAGPACVTDCTDTKIGSDGVMGSGLRMLQSTIGISSGGQGTGRYASIPIRSSRIRFTVN